MVIAKKLALTLNKTDTLRFITNNSPLCPGSIGCDAKYTQKRLNTKLLGLQRDRHLSWKNNHDKLILKLHEASKFFSPTNAPFIKHIKC
jgi:hypothetical protein